MMNGFVEAVNQLATVSWKWSGEDWVEISSALDLKKEEQVDGRETYNLQDFWKLDRYTIDGETFRVEVTLDYFLHPDRLTSTEYEDLVDEFYEKFGQYVNLANQVLGPPQFDDGLGADNFPESLRDAGAIWLALWQIKGGLFTIQETHEDKELPFRIMMVIIPNLE